MFRGALITAAAFAAVPIFGSVANCQPVDQLLRTNLAEPANPLDLDLSIDDVNGITKTIGPKGGSISLTSSKGAVFDLDVPVGALPFEIPITLAPLSSVEGLPRVDKISFGLSMKPSGLTFAVPAKLTFTPPPQTQNGRPIFGLAFGSDGNDAHLVPFKVSGGKVESLVEHFSGSVWEIVGPPTYIDNSATIIEEAGRQYEAIIDSFRARHEKARIESFIRGQIQSQHDCAIRTGNGCAQGEVAKLCESLSSLAPNYAQSSFAALTTPDTTCNDAISTMSENLGIERQAELLGCNSTGVLGNNISVVSEQGPQNLRPWEIISDVCKKDKQAMCRKSGNVAELINVFMNLERQGQLVGESDAETSLDFVETLRSCGKFKIVMETKGKTDTNDEVNCKNHLTTEVTLTAEMAPEMKEYGIVWNGEVAQHTGAYEHSSTCSSGDYLNPISLAPSVPGKVKMTVLVQKLDDASMNISNYLVVIDPGEVTMTFEYGTDMSGPSSVSAPDWWSDDFRAAHVGRRQAEGFLFSVPETGEHPIVARGVFQDLGHYVDGISYEVKFDSAIKIEHLAPE